MNSPTRLSSRSSPKRSLSRRKRQPPSCLYLLLGAFIAFLCVSITGFALYRSGFVPFGLSSGLTATAVARNNASCQVLIDMAIQASGNYCDSLSSNTVCYGNTSIDAELISDSTQRFSERGDIITTYELRRLSASPLNLDNSEWGIAVFKLIANLPRSLPGETVTMVVFGNTTLENDSPASENLESIYFFSELGRISCDKVPFDGLYIDTPEGKGIQLKVNGAELTLKGSATLKAQKNDKMEISVYSGSARIVSGNSEKYFGAGQKVSVGLGGANGNQAIGEPSDPEPLSQDELKMACTLTGQYCSEGEITPISADEAQGQIESEITPTPTLTPTQTLTSIPTITFEPTNTLLVLPSPTLSPTITFTPKPPTATKIPPTRTNTSVPTSTPEAPTIPICGSASTSGLTNPSPNVLEMAITNNSGATITLNRFFAYWVKTPASQKLDRLLLDTELIWNTSDSNTPSDIPAEGPWKGSADRTITNGSTRTLVIRFQNDLQTTGYEVHAVFDIGCQLIGNK